MFDRLRNIYRHAISEEARKQIYKWRHPQEIRDIRTAVFPSPKGDFSLRAFDRHQCIFVHITKTAGTSIALSLFQELPYHYTAIDYRVFFGKRDFNRYFKFAFVRNPWARTLSAYQYLNTGGWNENDRSWAQTHLKRYKTFEHFVNERLTAGTLPEHIHFKPQHEFVTDRRGNLLLDHLGYNETIQLDFQVVADRLGLPATLKHTNASKSSDYRTEYTPSMHDIVASVYKTDIDLFGYDFNGIAQRRIINSERGQHNER